VAGTFEEGYTLAERALEDGSALNRFLAMVAAQGGDVSVFDDPDFHEPGATRVVEAWESGFVASMETAMLGWAVQRTGAGREQAGQPVDPHAGIYFHVRRGDAIQKGQPVATLYATHEGLLGEPEELLRRAIAIGSQPTEVAPLVSRIFDRRQAEAYLRQMPTML
jgi:pyrimidine-nucleoside phosphorylase